MAKRILIVEDEFSIASMFKYKMELHGYKVAIGSDGEEGFVLAKSFVPDIILLDLKLPRMSGEEMLRRLRNEEWGGSIKVIVFTNVSKDEIPLSLRFLKVSAYLVKADYTPQQVLDRVEHELSKD